MFTKYYLDEGSLSIEKLISQLKDRSLRTQDGIPIVIGAPLEQIVPDNVDGLLQWHFPICFTMENPQFWILTIYYNYPKFGKINS